MLVSTVQSQSFYINYCFTSLQYKKDHPAETKNAYKSWVIFRYFSFFLNKLFKLHTSLKGEKKLTKIL